MGPEIFGFLFDNIGTTVESFITNTSAKMMEIIGVLATALFTIYVLLWGVALASGQISEPFTDGMKRIVRMAIIIALATTVGVYQDMIVSTFKDAPMQIASQLTLGGGASTPDANAMGSLLDEMVKKGMDVAGKPWEKAVELHDKAWINISAAGLVLQGLSVLLVLIAITVTAVAGGYVFVAYLALAILLGIGPLFLIFAIFPATQRWAEAWLGQVVNYALLFIIMSLAVSLLFTMLIDYFDQLIEPLTDALDVGAAALWMALKAVGLAIVMIAVLMQVAGIAAALSGGAQIQAANLAGKLAGAGMSAAATGSMFGRGVARLPSGGGGRGRRGDDPAMFRPVSHVAGGLVASAASRVRQTFNRKNTISGN